MTPKTAFLLLNGQAPKKLPDLSKFDVICATDGAYNTLKEHQITPHFISGDLDSITQTPKALEVIHTPDQNFTDFDKILAILYIKDVTKVVVYGASGKSQDHFLGNLHTAVVWKNKLELTFFDDYTRYFLADKKTHLTDCKGKIVSLIPFNKAKHITTKGLEFPLKKKTLKLGKCIGTRNKAIKNEVTIKYKSGNLFIFIEN